MTPSPPHSNLSICPVSKLSSSTGGIFFLFIALVPYRAAQQWHAPDRESRGFHPRDSMPDTLNARRVMPSVRLLLECRVKTKIEEG